MNGLTLNAGIDAVNAVEVAERLNWQDMRRPRRITLLMVNAAALEFLPTGPHQVAAMANLGAELLQEIQAYRPQFLFKRSPAEIVGALIEEIALSDAASDVLTERRRQIEKEGYDHKHDDAHPCGEISAYATFYAMPQAVRDWPAEETGYGATWGEAIIPADWGPPKACDRRQELVKAAALLVAEIERLDRAKEKDEQ